MEQQIVFSERAYVAILRETLKEINTETGGVFLGHFENGKWYIVESLAPGPQSTFSPVTFEYDVDFVNYLANKTNVLYKRPPRIMGLWHRHPGSMDTFSSTDNGTHEKFSHLNPYGIVSMLVNIDPTFRLSVYNVFRHNGRLVVPNRKLPFIVGDRYIPRELLAYESAESLKKQIDEAALKTHRRHEKNSLLARIIRRTFASNYEPQHRPRLGEFGEAILDMVDRRIRPVPVPVLDNDIEKIVEAFEDDNDFFGRQGIVCKMSKTRDDALVLYGENEPGKRTSVVEIFTRDGDIYVRHENKTIPYRPGLFSETTGHAKGVAP